jgi:hypothetical protein
MHNFQPKREKNVIIIIFNQSKRRQKRSKKGCRSSGANTKPRCSRMVIYITLSEFTFYI